MCSPAILIPAAIGGGMGLLQGMGNKAQADAQAKALRQNAVYLKNAAEDAKVRGMIDSDQVRVQGQQVIGSQRAAMAGSGGVVDEGSNAILQQDAAQLSELDALTVSNNAAREAYGYEVERADALTTAKNLKKNARRSMLTSVLGGALQGGAMAYAAGAFAPSAGAVNLQGQAAPLTNNAAFVKNM
jgi:hypothetical protein